MKPDKTSTTRNKHETHVYASFLKPATRNKDSGNTRHVWRVVTIRHHLSTPFHNLQDAKISISLHHQTTRKSGRLHVFPLTSHHCPFLFKSTARLPVDGSTWTLYHPHSARVHWTTLFVTETSFQFKECYSESLQQFSFTKVQVKFVLADAVF